MKVHIQQGLTIECLKGCPIKDEVKAPFGAAFQCLRESECHINIYKEEHHA